MDVRCERCKTLYELDDVRVSEAGTTVRCTTCGHLFRVRKKVFLMTEAVVAGGESTAVPPPVVEKPAWRVRSPSGRVIAFRELTSMQKWIVERKFGRDDEVSLHGDHWKRLGEIAELQPFFLLLDEVDRVRALEERLRRAELPDEAPSRLEEELGATSSGFPRAPNHPTSTPTPIRLETPIEAPPEETRRPDPELDAPAPPTTEPPRTGAPSAFSLEEIREATRPSPDDAPMPEGTVEPPRPAEDAEQPQFTRRAGLGVDPGVVDDADGWEPPTYRSKAPWVATLLLLAAVGGAAAAYFKIWVPAQEEKLRQEAQRARLQDSERARAAADTEVQERERRAKEELLAGMASRVDAGPGSAAPTGGAIDAGTGGSASPEQPRGSLESPGPGAPAPSPRTVASVSPPPRPRPAPGAGPRANTFDAWMAQGDRERQRARAQEAFDAYEHAVAIQPARPEGHVAQGLALLDLGNARLAVAAFRRALAANPRYSVAEFWLGEAYLRLGQTKEAAAAYGRYLEAAPEGAEAARAREALNALR